MLITQLASEHTKLNLKIFTEPRVVHDKGKMFCQNLSNVKFLRLYQVS